MNKVILSIAMIAGVASFAHADVAPSTITISKGQSSLDIKLKSNDGTGYTWFLTNYNSNYLTPVSHTRYSDKSSNMGRETYDVFSFQINSPANIPISTEVSFSSLRSWDAKDAPKTESFDILINP